MSEKLNLASSHMQSLDQDQFCINSPIADDDQMTISTSWRKSVPLRKSSPFTKYQIGRSSARRRGIVLIKSKANVPKQIPRKSVDDINDEGNSGSEKDNLLEESFGSQGENERTPRVQDIINYFESKAEASNSTRKDSEADVRRRSTLASPEKVSNRRWSGVSSCGSSQISIEDRTSVSAEGCSSTYECIHDYELQSMQHAQKMDPSGGSFKSERDKGRFDEQGLAIPDDAIFSSQGSRRGLQSGSCCDFDGLRNSLESEGMQTNNFAAPGYESELKMEQYLLAYDSKLRLKSELMRLPSTNIRKETDNFRDFAKYETELFDDINRTASQKKVAVDDSFIIPQRRGVSDPVLQAHVYVNNDLDKLMSQWSNLHNVEHSVSSDCFIVPARSMSNKQTDTSWKTDLNIEAVESTICDSKSDASYVHKKQKDEEHPTYYDDLVMMPERSFGRATTADRSRMFPLDCDVKLMNSIGYDKESPKRKDDKPGERMRTQKKIEPLGLKKAANTSDPRGLQKDLAKTKSQLPVRSITKSSSKAAVGASRAGSLVSKNINPLKAKREQEEARKRVEDTRLQRSDKTSGQRNSLAPAKSVDTITLRRASSLQLPSTTPKNITKLSQSSPNTGKVVISRASTSSDSARSSATDSHIARMKQHSPNIVNRTISVEKPRMRSVPCSLEIRKDTDKPLPGRSTSAIVRQQNVPPHLRKAQEKSFKPGIGAALVNVEANGGIPRPLRNSSSTVKDTKRSGLTKGKL